MTLSKLNTIESLASLLVWIAALLLGTDFPPSKGFFLQLVLVVILTFLQNLLGGWLFTVIGIRPTFVRTLVAFAVAGAIASTVLAVFSSELISRSSRLIFVLAISLVSCGYGVLYWSVNRLVVPKLARYR